MHGILTNISRFMPRTDLFPRAKKLPTGVSRLGEVKGMEYEYHVQDLVKAPAAGGKLLPAVIKVVGASELEVEYVARHLGRRRVKV